MNINAALRRLKRIDPMLEPYLSDLRAHMTRRLQPSSVGLKPKYI